MAQREAPPTTEGERLIQHRCATAGCGAVLLVEHAHPRNWGRVERRCRRCGRVGTIYLGGYQRREGRGTHPKDGSRRDA